MKRLMVLLGIFILAFSLIACGQSQTGEQIVINAESKGADSNMAQENNDTETTETTDNQTNEASETETSSEEVLAVGSKIPNYELTTLEGETVSLHDYDGKIILLNFWATW